MVIRLEYIIQNEAHKKAIENSLFNKQLYNKGVSCSTLINFTEKSFLNIKIMTFNHDDMTKMFISSLSLLRVFICLGL